MKIIDIHTHSYPDDIAQKATDSIRDYYGIDGGHMNGTESMLNRLRIRKIRKDEL